jgi:hypothetical protein|tara:strand:+ start:1778 stop:1987 length:210 start_codon:yes stop_codon:yes gene_type:complete
MLIKKFLIKTKSIYIKKIMINWINGFDAGNKKEKYSLTFRLGTFTVLEIKVSATKFRFMIVNLGFELYY